MTPPAKRRAPTRGLATASDRPPSDPSRHDGETPAAVCPADESLEIVSLLRAHGLRATPQRERLVEVTRALPGHLSAEEVYEQVRATLPAVSKVSVYRGLETLCRHGMMTCTALGGHGVRYEWVGDRPHHHLLCSRCGRIDDLPDAEMDTLRECLATHYGFAADIGHFAIWGTCQICQTAAVQCDASR